MAFPSTPGTLSGPNATNGTEFTHLDSVMAFGDWLKLALFNLEYLIVLAGAILAFQRQVYDDFSTKLCSISALLATPFVSCFQLLFDRENRRMAFNFARRHFPDMSEDVAALLFVYSLLLQDFEEHVRAVLEWREQHGVPLLSDEEKECIKDFAVGLRDLFMASYMGTWAPTAAILLSLTIAVAKVFLSAQRTYLNSAGKSFCAIIVFSWLVLVTYLQADLGSFRRVRPAIETLSKFLDKLEKIARRQNAASQQETLINGPDPGQTSPSGTPQAGSSQELPISTVEDKILFPRPKLPFISSGNSMANLEGSVDFATELQNLGPMSGASNTLRPLRRAVNRPEAGRRHKTFLVISFLAVFIPAGASIGMASTIKRDGFHYDKIIYAFMAGIWLIVPLVQAVLGHFLLKSQESKKLRPYTHIMTSLNAVCAALVVCLPLISLFDIPEYFSQSFTNNHADTEISPGILASWVIIMVVVMLVLLGLIFVTRIGHERDRMILRQSEEDAQISRAGTIPLTQIVAGNAG